MKTLYLCYFGIQEPLVQTQVVPYLRVLAAAGIDTYLLTFEPGGGRGCNTPEGCRRMREELAADGITWHRQRYHRRPSVPATAFDIGVGIAHGARLARRYRIDLFHARSHVPALMAMVLKRALGGQFLFDFRGLMAEESVEAGRWPVDGARHRAVKRLEGVLLREADAVVVLTNRIRSEFFDEEGQLRVEPAPGRRRAVAVIPCCVDLGRFAGAGEQRARVRRTLGLGAGTVLAYLGTLGGYYLTEELAELVAAARRIEPEARLLALSREGDQLLRRELAKRGVPEDAARILAVAPGEVPPYLAAADAGVSLRRPGFATRACSPTKVAEYLAAGLPVLSNAGVGDTDEILRTEGVGVILGETTREALATGFEELRHRVRHDASLPARCRAAARRWFDLNTVGGPAYVAVYRELAHRRLSRSSIEGAVLERGA